MGEVGGKSGETGAVVDLSDPGRYRAPTDDCDMIMKGGITSGLVYPQAVCRLAGRYRLRRLGGASAGAIAAVFAAAAEHGRDAGGFVTLAAIPDQLGANLASLFQPSRRTRPAYRVLTTFLQPRWGLLRKGGAAAGLIVWHGVVGVLVGLALVLGPAFGIGALLGDGPSGGRTTATWLPVAVVLALAAAPVAVVVRTLLALPANGYGLCTGSTDARTPPRRPPLTEWMCTRLDQLAGVEDVEDVGPLTFGQLWGPEAVAEYRRLRACERTSAAEWRAARELRRVDLEVMTTNLTFRRPYRFPFAEPSPFYFCPRCFRDYFPDDLVEHMVGSSGPEIADQTDQADEPGAPSGPGGPGETGGAATIRMLCPRHDEPVRVHRLPDVPDLPVVLAARLSLSFPGLISAVPLLCVDRSRKRGRRDLIVVWFSDGGIASNFPMHLFDSLWPKRPTFGINLQPQHRDFPDQLVWRPTSAEWKEGIAPRSHPIGSMVGFGQAILDTMQNWVDSTQVVLPGYLDRVAELRQGEREGGINLRMPPTVISTIARRGAEAAALFDDFDFELHRWIRYRVSMSELDEAIDTLAERYPDAQEFEGYERFLGRYGPTALDYPLGSDTALTADLDATRELMDLSAAWAAAEHPASAGDVPQPKPILRIVPRQ